MELIFPLVPLHLVFEAFDIKPDVAVPAIDIHWLVELAFALPLRQYDFHTILLPGYKTLDKLLDQVFVELFVVILHVSTKMLLFDRLLLN